MTDWLRDFLVRSGPTGRKDLGAHAGPTADFSVVPDPVQPVPFSEAAQAARALPPQRATEPSLAPAWNAASQRISGHNQTAGPADASKIILDPLAKAALEQQVAGQGIPAGAPMPNRHTGIGGIPERAPPSPDAAPTAVPSAPAFSSPDWQSWQSPQPAAQQLGAMLPPQRAAGSEMFPTRPRGMQTMQTLQQMEPGPPPQPAQIPPELAQWIFSQMPNAQLPAPRPSTPGFNSRYDPRQYQVPGGFQSVGRR